jgi:hypothetical protein
VSSALSQGQQNALLRFASGTGVIDGILWAHTGVSLPTAGILVQRGLATWAHDHVSLRSGRRGRDLAIRTWGIELTAGGQAALRELTAKAS